MGASPPSCRWPRSPRQPPARRQVAVPAASGRAQPSAPTCAALQQARHRLPFTPAVAPDAGCRAAGCARDGADGGAAGAAVAAAGAALAAAAASWRMPCRRSERLYSAADSDSIADRPSNTFDKHVYDAFCSAPVSCRPMGGRCLCCCGMPHGCDWPAPRRVSSARRSDSGQRNSPGLNAQPGAPARAGASHGACNASECSPRLAQMRPSSQPTVHRLLKKHSDECGTGDAWQAGHDAVIGCCVPSE